MSNSDAIATVTATLISLLGGVSEEVDGATATAQPPDKAADGLQEGQGRINLFLYQTSINAAWRNMDLPHRTKPGEQGHPPLALNLHYLLTPYTGDHNAMLTQRLLGSAMRILHDNAELSREIIKGITPNGELHEQIESVKITPQPLSIDEMSKLWNMFQTQYRTSAAYEASVVLIESTRPKKAAPPVLQRGYEDEGIFADLLPLPTLTKLELPLRQPSLRLGEKLVVHGKGLDGDPVSVRLSHPSLAEPPPPILPLPGATATKLTILLRDEDHALYPAGFYTLAVRVTQKPEGRRPVERITNELPFALAPWVTIPENALTLVKSPDEEIYRALLSLESKPDVWPGQRVFVLLGSFDSAAEPHPDRINILKFDVSDIPVGEYLVRLRIDGVDSLPIKDFDDLTKPLTFRDDQKVTLTPLIIMTQTQIGPDPQEDTKRVLFLKCKPNIWPNQEATLLIHNVEIKARAHPQKTDALMFDMTGIPPGEYRIILRVDEISSAADENYKVIILNE